MAEAVTKNMDSIVALCRRRGFIWQSSEIYGGINGFWDYGPLGTELKRNLKDAWWHDIVRCPPKGPGGDIIDMVGVDCTIIMNPKIWVASGHVEGFNDPMVDCRACKARFRADKVFFLFISPQYPIISVQGDDLQHVADNAGTHLQNVAKLRNISELKRVSITSPPAYPQPRIAVVQFVDAKKQVHEARIAPQQDLLPPGSVCCPECGQENTLTEPRQFNLMFETYVGAIRDEENKAYLRPETAQGIFANWKNVTDTSRVKVPFGIAQIGKAFRNEVTPRNFTFRSREFEQMEIEFFIRPETANEWYAWWRDFRYQWWQGVGLAGDNLQLREHDKDELSHYAKEGAGTSDIEYRFPFTAPGFGELEGVAHRTDFDLRQHAQHSGLGDKLKYFDQERNERYFPHVIEPSAGADRGTLAILCEAFTPDPNRPSGVYMKFHPRMAPIKAAIFPLVNKDGMPEIAEKLYLELRQKYAVEFDVKQNIGKRYARMDEAGTPYCFTVDGETASTGTVTVRHRDTLAQERIALDKVGAFLAEKIGG